VFTILHISDLHRSPDDPISNTVLLSSLTADHAKYRDENPACPSPNAIIVSGDIVQGVRLGTPNAAEQIADQYRVATEFLDSLTKLFLDGDRSRIVIVPGNHDVDWNMARAAIGPPSDPEILQNLSRSSFSPRSPLRWSWSDLSVYTIVDRDAYELRLKAFRDFYDSFYASADRRLRQTPYGYWDLFELHDGRIAVAGFNSCANNDCFRLCGQIPDDAVAGAHLTIDRECSGAELLMAVWHHSIEGGPDADDYMDLGTIHRMIGGGFRLGLHGHQHRAQISSRYVRLPEAEQMAVVSAGSLCAGPVELPTGVNRQYNVIVLNEDLSRARVHIREMAVETVFGPAMRAELGGTGFVDLSWDDDGFRARAVRAKRARREAAVLGAERAWKAGEPALAKQVLSTVDAAEEPYARSLLLRVLQDDQDYEGIENAISVPADINELTVLVEARITSGRFAAARQALADWSNVLGLPQPQRNDLDARITAAESMAQS
jgi:hypothetical protein